MTESAIQKQILDYLKMRGFIAFRNNVGHVRVGSNWINLGEAGMSDIIGMLPGGKFLAIEVKTPKGKIRPPQLEFLHKVNEGGGLGIVARSVEEVAALV